MSPATFVSRLASKLLGHPLLVGCELDDPATTELHRQIIDRNQFLCKVYSDWYSVITANIPSGPGGVLELGSGPGHIERFLVDTIKSDLLLASGVHLLLDAHVLPFASASLRAIVMTNVFHHLHSPPLFLAEAERCVRPGGRLVMIEPWVTPWSRIIYHYLHHEFFGPEVEAWEIAEGGPLSGANGALPWIVFNRDGQRFKREFPNWDLSVTPWMPFRYLVSGGVSMRPLMPGWTYGLWSAAEGVLRPWVRDMAMFAIIVLTHRNE